MCGICGIINPNGVDKEILLAMREAMIHRGPDDDGVYLNHDRTAGLGHRRLSIIDLTINGRNPIANEDGQIQIILNGEFYNYKDYTDQLKKKGHHFHSNTDTEVALHLYEECGIDFLQKMRGMFALAIWDERKQELILARDRVGIKPLYYSIIGNGMAFASEIKALLRYPKVDRELNPEALNAYFMLGYIPNPISIYKNVHKLKPGHVLIWRDGQINLQEYWKLPMEFNEVNQPEDELLDNLQALIEDAVRLRLISDVPLGVFLSGGVDSSIVACTMSKFSSQPVKTFSIGFKESEYNELRYARRVAEHIGAEHHELILEPEASKTLVELVRQFDEPFADSSMLPQFYVSRMAREHVTVALGGDGGDELFGGYNWYSWVLEGENINHVLGPLAKAGPAVKKYWPDWVPGKNHIGQIGQNPYDQFTQRVNIFDGLERSKLLSNDLKQSMTLNDPIEFMQCEFRQGNGLLDEMQRTDFHTYLPEDILTKVDRTSMLVSLEARVPLLDHLLVEFAFSLPDKYKINTGTKKYILKKLARRMVPEGFPLERKKGFSIPVAYWLKKDLASLINMVLSNEEIWNYLDKSHTTRLFREHQIGFINHGAQLWAILCFGLWVEHVYLS